MFIDEFNTETDDSSLFLQGKVLSIIVDFDGTLTKGPLERRIMEFEYSINDLENHIICGLVRNLSLGYHIIIVTGREEKYREITEQWLEKHCVPFNQIWFRKNDDQRPSEIIKKEIYQDKIENYYTPVLSIEDRTENINMWKDLGILTLEVYCIVKC